MISLQHLDFLLSLPILTLIYPIMDMFITVNNTTGDLAGTLLVAKTEGKADMDVFYGRKKI